MPAAEMRTATPDHESVLPGHVPPMLMPETRGENRLLPFFLNAGLFPTYQRAEERGARAQRDRTDGTGRLIGLREHDLEGPF